MFTWQARRYRSPWLGLFLILALVPLLSPAQENVPPPGEELAGPPNPNPTGKAIYPGRGQSAEQQLADQWECYDWVCDQMDWDPYQAYAELADAGYAVALSRQDLAGGLVCEAVRGAETGAVAGEITGDSARGEEVGVAIAVALELIRRGYLFEEDDPRARRVVSRFERSLEKWDRKYSGCLKRKGYRVPSR